MQKVFRLLWVVMLLLSLGWAVGGALVVTGALEDVVESDQLREEIVIFTDGLDVPPEIPSWLLFVFTGLPLALLSLFFARRNHRALALQAGAHNQQRHERRVMLGITGLSLMFALLLWNAHEVDALLEQHAPALGAINLTAVTYPVRLFVTFVHEAAHVLAALLTGGQVLGFTVSPNGAGVATTAGGSALLILPAGYLGAALFGSALFLLSSRAPSLTRALSMLLGIGFIALTVLYAHPDAGGNLTALVVGLSFGGVLMLLGGPAPQGIAVFFLNTLAILVGLNAVFDLTDLASNPDIGTPGLVNDATRFSQDIVPLLPPSTVALLWAGIAICMMGVALYFGVLKPVRNEMS